MNRWTYKEIEILKDNYEIKSHEDLCNILPNKTWSAIKTKAKRLKLWFWGITEERFWKYVDKKENNQCWNWIGYNVNGYGKININGKLIKTHRFSWILHNGEITEEKPCVLHHCDNPKCVNPNHLFLGTIADNNKDRDDKDRQGNHQGENHGRAKLTEDQVKEIRQLCCQEKLLQKEIAQIFNIGQSAIWKINNKKTWRHVI